MKLRCSSKGIYHFDNLEDSQAGSRIARDFFQQLCQEIVCNLKRHFDKYDEDDWLRGHGFQFYEQQTKTFITPALASLTDMSLIQERPIERHNYKRWSGRGRSPKTSRGRADYWANYKDVTFLVEIKQGWTRFFPERRGEEEGVSNCLNIYSSTRNKFTKKSQEQLHKIDNKGYYKQGNELYSLFLLISPVFVGGPRHKELNAERMDEDVIYRLADMWESKNANMFALWRLNGKYLNFKNEWPESHEYYPAVCFIGNLVRQSRTR